MQRTFFGLPPLPFVRHDTHVEFSEERLEPLAHVAYAYAASVFHACAASAFFILRSRAAFCIFVFLFPAYMSFACVLDPSVDLARPFRGPKLSISGHAIRRKLVLCRSARNRLCFFLFGRFLSSSQASRAGEYSIKFDQICTSHCEFM